MKAGVSERSDDGGELERRQGNDLTIILLAAGPSSRMGKSKQQLPIHGKPLLTRAVETALLSGVKNVIVVLGAGAEEHRKLLTETSVEIIVNPNWQAGMGSSLKAGLRHALSKNPKTDAIIVMVCDQPLLHHHHVNKLIERYRKTHASIVASAYSNTTGVPALFNLSRFDEILKLSDEQGAKKVIQQHHVEVIDFPEGAIDLDFPEDYKNFIEGNSKKMP